MQDAGFHGVGLFMGSSGERKELAADQMGYAG
jgi:hypothetical protein